MLQNTSFKVFMATALGAFIGSVLVIQLAPMYWWVGMLVGAIIGYIAFDPMGILRMMPEAWINTRSILTKSFPALARELLTLIATLIFLIVHLVRVVFWLSVATLSGATWAVLLALAICMVFRHETSLRLVDSGVVENAVLILALGAVVAMIFALNEDTMRRTLNDDEPLDTRQVCLNIFRQYNLPSVLIRYLPSTLLWVVKLLWWSITGLVAGIVFLATFFWVLFKLIHSDLRLLCFFDAAIGTFIGSSTHNPLVGMLIGGLVGVLNYELISKRWLKIVPA